ncbi:MAG: hypothetical protein AB7V23_15390, partial [Candidatus Nanopelagicales bacterium]
MAPRDEHDDDPGLDPFEDRDVDDLDDDAEESEEDVDRELVRLRDQLRGPIVVDDEDDSGLGSALDEDELDLWGPREVDEHAPAAPLGDDA